MADHIVEVTKAKGALACLPDKLKVRPGDRMVWVGVDHKGWFDGPSPSHQREWVCNRIVCVSKDAKKGRYKYSVQAPGMPVHDPEVEVLEAIGRRRPDDDLEA